MTKKGDKGGKNGGGKGGPKGGKGPIHEVALEGEWGEGAGDNEGVENIEGEEWYFNTISSLVPSSSPPRQNPARAHGPQREAAARTLPEPQGEGGVRAAADRKREPAPSGPQREAAARTLPEPQGEGSVRAAPNRKRKPLAISALSLLVDGAEPLLGAVAAGRKGRIVEAVVDSGAVHSVTPPARFPGKMSSSPWSRAGRGYRAANGTGIKNLGQQQVAFGTSEGHRCQIPFQVAEVEQPLLSVAHLASAGNRVELGEHDGRIVNLTTGRTIALEKRGGVYILRMFIADGEAPLPFHRQGA